MHRATRSRQVLEMRDDRSSDRISTLPDEILIFILSFLSTCDALKTRVLSTRWRFIFPFASILLFDDQEYFGRWVRLRVLANQTEELKMSFQRFVDRVLSVHIMSPIQKFSLILGETYYDSSKLCMWITAAVKKEVRHLHVSTSLLPNALPNCLFYSETLVSLNISTPIQYHLNVPGIMCLPSLKTLQLQRITFLDGDSVKRFFIGCSQLKELVLHFCQLGTDHICVSVNTLKTLMIIICIGDVEIDAPNLEDITYVFTSCTVEAVVKNTRSLSSVTMGFVTCEMSDPPEAIGELITSAYNARDLSLMDNSLKLLARDQPKQIPTYSNLKNLRLGNCCLESWKYLPFLLANSAQLETVVFQVGLVSYDTHEIQYAWDPHHELAPFSSNVKYIEVHQFGGYQLEMQLLKYLLENAGVLMRLVLYAPGIMPMLTELQLNKELLMLPKASTYCTIELKDPELYYMQHSMSMESN